MNNRFLQRWKYFAVAALAACAFTMMERILSLFLIVPLVSLCWALALFFVRKSRFTLTTSTFIFVATTVCSFAFSQVVLFSGPEQFVGLTAVLLGAMGVIIGVASAGAHDRFLSRDHPSLALSAIAGGITFIIPFLIINYSQPILGINLWAYDNTGYALSWMLLLGILFSRETRDDQASDSTLTDMIDNIGKE